MSKSPDEITKALAEPFPPQALKRRSDRGSTFTYVEGHTVFRRLIDATGNRFDVAVIDQSITPYGQTAKGADRVIITARVRLTIPELGSREHMGVQVTSIGSGEDLYKGAISDAIKKAATLFGVGLDLYGPDYEAGEIDDHPVSQRPAPRRDAPQTRQDQRSAPEASEQGAGDPGATMKRLHAALAAHSITHTDLHDYYAAKGKASLSDVPAETLERMARWASEADTETVQGEFARVLAGPAQGRLTDAPAAPVSGGSVGADRWTN